jgi:hypothetical protein
VILNFSRTIIFTQHLIFKVLQKINSQLHTISLNPLQLPVCNHSAQFFSVHSKIRCVPCSHTGFAFPSKLCVVPSFPRALLVRPQPSVTIDFRPLSRRITTIFPRSALLANTWPVLCASAAACRFDTQYNFLPLLAHKFDPVTNMLILRDAPTAAAPAPPNSWVALQLSV